LNIGQIFFFLLYLVDTFYWMHTLANKHLFQLPTNLHNSLLANKHNPLMTYTINIQCNNMTSTNNLMPKNIPTKTTSTKQNNKPRHNNNWNCQMEMDKIIQMKIIFAFHLNVKTKNRFKAKCSFSNWNSNLFQRRSNDKKFELMVEMSFQKFILKSPTLSKIWTISSINEVF
jgi:hypothetical protein